MNSLRLAALGLFTCVVLGCGGAPPREIPKVTPEEKAELDKQHQEKLKESNSPGGTP